MRLGASVCCGRVDCVCCFWVSWFDGLGWFVLHLVVVGLGVALGLFYGSGWFDWFVGCVLLLCWFVGFWCWLWFLDLRWFSGVVCLCLICWCDLLV